MINPQKILRENVQRANAIHQRFLELRKTTLEGVESLLKLQLAAARPFPSRIESAPEASSTTLFDSYHLAEFAAGSLANCFGSEYEAYSSRRFPRIPNGDLALISRVLAIHGEKYQLDRPASLVSEFDVPGDAWFITHYSPAVSFRLISVHPLLARTRNSFSETSTGREGCWRGLIPAERRLQPKPGCSRPW
jgi:hypothetical protein